VNTRLTVTLLALKDALGSLTPGSPVTLQIQREGRLMYISFTLE
jgi:S1-C subfamily serine protease